MFKENFKKVRKQEIQEFSEIDLFNKIGLMTEILGYTPVYFKVLNPKMVDSGDSFSFEYKYMHYIHLYKNEEMKISIYYDKYNLGAMFPGEPYYELYDMCYVERFLDTEEDRNDLLNRLKELLD